MNAVSCHLESSVVESLRAYASARNRGDEFVVVDRLRELCSSVARLTGELLQSQSAWGQHRWVDDMLPTHVEVPHSHMLLLQGWMIWGERGSKQQWIEPLSATLQWSDQGRLILKYEITLGDALTGIGAAAYRSRSVLETRTPTKWFFSFSSLAEDLKL